MKNTMAEIEIGRLMILELSRAISILIRAESRTEPVVIGIEEDYSLFLWKQKQ